MVEFQKPTASSNVDHESKEASTFFESPPQTAVNTAVPSRAPSISIGGEDLEDGIEAEKRVSKALHDALGGVDPITHVVGWNGPDDPENPMNWPRAKKWRITMVTAMMTFCVSFASSIFSTATQVTAVKFNVSLEVMILGVSLYVLGFACGPLVWGPLSEVYGRTRPLFFGFFVFAIFQIPLAARQQGLSVHSAQNSGFPRVAKLQHRERPL